MHNCDKDLPWISLAGRGHMHITLWVSSYKQVYKSRDITQFG